jgi:hypothetical protein
MGIDPPDLVQRLRDRVQYRAVVAMTRALAILAMIATGALFGAWIVEAALAEADIAAEQRSGR